MVFASSAILLNNKKILLIKRSSYTHVFPKHWECPGGRAELHETPEQNVIREVQEEINLEFSPTKLFATGTYEDRELYRFLGDWNGDIHIQKEEIDDYQWCTYEEAIKLKLAFDYRNVIEKLHHEGLI